MATATETIRWQDLLVTDAEGDSWDTLGEIVDRAPANLDGAVLNEDGAIAEWPQFFLSAEGEEADWDTPRVAVSWDGLREKLGR